MPTSRAPHIPERIRWTVERLDLAPADRVLEIGCGPGHAVGLVAERLTTGTIAAIDRSATMVARARAWNAALLDDARVAIEEGALERLEGPPRFDLAFAVNVNAFWTSPAPSFEAVRRVLAPGGRLCLAYEPPGARALADLRRSLPPLAERHGFTVAAVHGTAFARGHGLLVAARL